MTMDIFRSSGRHRLFCNLVALVLFIPGLSLLVGGGILVCAGGSFYYALTGLLIVTSAILVARNDARGPRLYILTLIWTVFWSFSEVGWSGWQLAPRLAVLFVLGSIFLLPPLRRLAHFNSWPHRFPSAPMMLGGFCMAVALGTAVHAISPSDPVAPVLRNGVQSAFPDRLAQPMSAGQTNDWPTFGNDQGGTRFSPLADINLRNVGHLQKLWEADMGPLGSGKPNGPEVTPIMIGDAFYACDGYNHVVAFDAETGRLRWRQDTSDGVQPSGKPCRGVAYYRVPGATGPCAERIFFANQTPNLLALDAASGALCSSFGKEGRVDLRDGISPYPHGQYYVSSAPQVIHGKVVVGGGIPDGQFWGGPSGVIRASDAITGDPACAYDPGQPARI